jgi:predicted alpha/beta superfamily hydrolase
MKKSDDRIDVSNLVRLKLGCLTVLLFFVHSALTSLHAQSTSATSNVATITWIVSVPANTPATAKLFLAGNQDEFGPWKPNQFQLNKLSDGTYQAKATFPVGTSIEYKLTRGSWASVEKSSTGAEIQNRTLRVDKDAIVRVEIAAWAIPSKEPVSTATGDLRWKDFDSQTLAGSRRITVWLPPGYRDITNPSVPSETIETPKRYRVVYFLDGQNVFDATRAPFGAEWQADETALRLSQKTPALNLILVAIDNSKERIGEYTTVQDRVGDSLVGGQADKYLTFITQELKPWIDSQFATDPNPESTVIAGSSLGGLFALYALFQQPQTFGNAIAMSPSLFWGNEAMLQSCKRSAIDTWDQPKQKLWIDMGTEEGDTASTQERNVARVQSFVQLLDSNFAKRFEKQLMIAPKAKHNEAAWASRLPDALEFIFPPAPAITPPSAAITPPSAAITPSNPTDPHP